jgi:hypothetical protein
MLGVALTGGARVAKLVPGALYCFPPPALPVKAGFLVDNFVGSRPIMCLAGWLDLPFVMEIIKWTDVDVQTGGASFGYKHGALAAGSTLYVSSTCYMENAFCVMIMLVFQLCVKLAK